MNPSDAWDRIRSTLARPPRYARDDERRRTTYQAALQQCEELLKAAEVSGPSARPLPLFYALNQAGRAMAAAFAGASPDDTRWRLATHGIAQVRSEIHDAMDMRIEPAPSDEDEGDTFAIVAEAIGSSVLTDSVALGELYAALPDLEAKPVPDSCRWLRPLYVEEYDDPSDPLYGRLPLVRATVVSPDGAPVDGLPLDRYPTLREPTSFVGEHDTLRGRGCVLRWNVDPESDEQWRLLDEMAPLYRFSQERWVVPTVGNGEDHLAPLMLWWALLFGYSILARYEPAAWTKAIDLRTEPWAAAIIASLDEALSSLPELIWMELGRRDGA